MPFSPNAPYASGKGTAYDRMTSEEKKRWHEQNGGKWNWGGAAKGAATGFGVGLMTGNPYAMAGGALAGGYIGGRAGAEQERADATRQAAMDQAIASQGGLQREMEARRQQDLERTMALYGPALQELERLYGVPMSAWGQAIPQNARAAMAPPRQGMLNGQPVNIANRRPEFQNLPVSSRPTPIQGLQKVGNLRPLFRSGG